MANLSSYNDIFSDLAQGAYNGRPVQFPYDKKNWSEEQIEAFEKEKAIEFDFSKNTQIVK